MSSGFGGLIAIMALVGLPAIIGGLFEWANERVWMWRLSKRIGEIPDEVYVPADVRSGWRPLGIALTVCFAVGIMLLVMANNLEIPALRVVGAPLFGVPLLVAAGLIFRWSLRQAPGFQAEGDAVAPEERRRHVERLNEGLERKRQEGEPTREHLQCWRAGHLLALACAEWDAAKSLNQEHALRAESDLDAVLAGSDDAGLKRTARQLKETLAILRELEAEQASKATGG